MNAAEIPSLGMTQASIEAGEGPSAMDAGGGPPPGMPAPPHLQGPSGINAGMPPPRGGNMFEGPPEPYQRGPPPEYLDALANKRQVEAAEEADFTAEVHGNWTIENAKGRLHQFLQMNKIKTDYQYSMVGADHNRSFTAEMSIPVRKFGRTISSRESGSNKQVASKSCALSLVRQLYHMKVIEPFTGIKKKNKENVLPPYEVAVSPELNMQISSVLRTFEVEPVPVVIGTKDEPASILIQQKLNEFEDSEHRQTRGGVVSWSPPQPNWNPWTGANIDEGPLAYASMEQIGKDLYEALEQQSQNDSALQAALEARHKLPVWDSHDTILEAIDRTPVVLVRGETGSGKTTQVCMSVIWFVYYHIQADYCYFTSLRIFYLFEGRPSVMLFCPMFSEKCS